MIEFECLMKDRMLTEDELARKGILLQYEELLKRSILETMIKSSLANEGDRNTKFFHRVANAHKRYNHIDQLNIQDELTQNASRMRR